MAFKRVSIDCRVCGKAFTAPLHDADKRKYCSYACLGRSKTLNATPFPIIPCTWCGEMISRGTETHVERFKKRRFCSDKCRAQWQASLPFGEWRAKIQKRHIESGHAKGERNAMYGRTPGHGRGAWVDTPRQGQVFMRSSWEVEVAGYLTSLGVKWLYEPQRFRLAEGLTYVPDFYIEDWECYWEIKGWFKEKDHRKAICFRSCHPDKPLVIVTQPVFDMIHAKGPFCTSVLAEHVKKLPGKPHSPESIDKMSEARKRWWAQRKAQAATARRPI